MTRRQQPTVPDLWSMPLVAASIPEAGTHRELTADAETRARIAAGLGLRDISRLEAKFDLQPLSGDRVHVTGLVSAVVGQNCVVTLEPLDSVVAEQVEATFAEDAREPEPEPESDDPNKHGSWEAEPPEPLVNGAIDLGALAVEFMMLGINPYPRKEGVAFAAPENPEDSQKHPFAALAKLKAKDPGS